MQNFMTKETRVQDMVVRTNRNILSIILLVLFFILTNQVFADVRTQAKRIHDRIAGVPPSTAVLNEMVDLLNGIGIDPKFGSDGEIAAAYKAMENKNFSNVTLVNFITPWTNEAQTVFPGDMGTEGVLNDYTATVIGAINDEIDFRRILYDDILYVGKAGLVSRPYEDDNNLHYKQLEERAGKDLSQDLELATQTNVTLLPAGAASGVLTSRAAAKAFFVDGTNRVMLRFTALNHLCQDMEEMKDVTLPADRIRQDVSRSPGGDSRIYMNECIGCHTGMDPMTQAFAFYDYTYPVVGGEPVYEDGQLSFNNFGDTDPVTGTRVKEKNLINADNFKPGYITTDDSWVNYWRQGKNSVVGNKVTSGTKIDNWDASPSFTGSGEGASSMAKELAHSEMFARCQVEKVFKTVCLRPPVDAADRGTVNSILVKFKEQFQNPANTEGYELKRVFAETAAYCKGP